MDNVEFEFAVRYKWKDMDGQPGVILSGQRWGDYPVYKYSMQIHIKIWCPHTPRR